MCTIYPEIFASLSAEFTAREVRVRQIAGRHISYVTARTVMNRLDSVLGPENWRDEYTPLQNGVLCTLSVRLPDGQWIGKSDAGGHAGMSDEGDDEKSGFSDAFKRAAVKWGVGRHLYGEGSPDYGGMNRQDAKDAKEGGEGGRKSGGDDAPPRGPARGPYGGDRVYGSKPWSPPKTGRELYGWIKEHPKEMLTRAQAVAASWGYPAKIVDLNREEVEALFRELYDKSRNGGFGNNGNGVHKTV